MFDQFVFALGFFHCSEFTLAFLFSPNEVTWKSWLFSKPYCIAMGTACLEFILWTFLAPGMRSSAIAAGVSRLGLAMVVLGELIRKTGYITAGRSFTHDIKGRKSEHSGRLVTTGIYRYIRHPGYLGWFIWAISTQVLLVNPICIVLFTVVSWKFFADRIPYEEYLLQDFFGTEYEQYKRRTGTWIPFIP
mmetsp:Transcript_25703/g.48762  ORF Transcript_25703/g.48762 Transcript_25703/m.48762 type:complete len:190 (+) Transcript_25703:110-679(+)